jgi:hypothetical protein
METTAKHQDHRRRTGLLALLVVGSAIISLTGSILSLAVFTDSQAVTGNTFTAGTIDISVDPGTAVLSATLMMPGDTVNGSAVVTNGGTAQLRYAITGIATNPPPAVGLASQITVTIKTLGASPSTCADWDGTELYSGVVPYATGNLVGDPTQGADAGDRTLDASDTETLCFRASLPLATDDDYQGATTTMTFTFEAEQTANNT